MHRIILAIEAWWKGLTSRRQTALAVCYDVSVCLLFWGNGAIAAIDFLRGKWLGWLNVAVTLLLCVVLVWRNYWWRKLLLAQKEQIKLAETANSALKDENLQLKEVALSAAAVKIMIEHGLPVNLEPFRRSLKPFESGSDLSKMN